TGHDSDAESTCQSGYHEDAGFYHGGAEIYHGDTDQSDTDKAWADEIHRQELNAYRSTLEALHASGPLTWEKETMLSSLKHGNACWAAVPVWKRHGYGYASDTPPKRFPNIGNVSYAVS
ncbi:EMSY domain-containing protein, partial [Tanacetum coccineum]